MPATYSEPYVTAALTSLTAFGRQGGGGAASGLVSTGTAANGSPVAPGTSATVVAQVTGVVVPANGKVILHCSVELDVDPPESGGVDGTATLFARYNTGGPATVVDSKQEDLFVGPEATVERNILHFTTETPPLSAGTYTFDVAASYTTGAATNVQAGKGRVTLLVVTV
jgi:hypothetical protein